MSYPIFGNLSLGNVSGNIKLFVNHSGLGNLTGIGYNNNAMTFGVNQSATDTPEMIINRIGDVNILGNVFTGGNVVVNAITPSTSTTTGALRVAGGVGIQGNVFTGGNVIINSTALSTSVTTGALQVAGGAGIVGNVYTGGNVVIQAIVPSTSTTTGALQVAGGAGIVGNVYTGGNVFINAIVPSTSVTTGALQVAGGAGIVGNVFTGGNVVINAIVPSTSVTTGALQVAGGVGIQGNIFLGGNLILNRDIDCNGNIQIDGTTSSVSTTTGALVVAGGAGIVGNVYTGGNVVIQAVAPSISTTTGALRVAGGVGIVGNVYTGGNVVINATALSTSITTGALQVAGGAGIRGNLNIGLDSFFNGNVQLTQTNNPLWLVSNNASAINTLASGSDVGIFYGATNPAAAGLVISPRGIGGGIKMATNGNVGIGTSNPLQLLEIQNPASSVGANTQMNITSFAGANTTTNTSTLNLRVQGAGGGMVDNTIVGRYFASGAGVYGFSINPLGTNVMNIISNGRVGIGNSVTNPQATLQLTSTGQNIPTLQVSDLSNSNTIRVLGNLAAIGFNNISQNNDVGIIYGSGTGLRHSLVIAPWETGPSGIRMDQNGNVGIGTSDPQFPLDVNGQVRANNLPCSFSLEQNAGSTVWVKVGVFTADQTGKSCIIKLYANRGYNADPGQSSITTIFFKTSNNISTYGTTGFAGDSYHYIQGGLSPFNSPPLWIANAAGVSATNYTLYLELGAHNSSTFYTAEVSQSSSCNWTQTIQYNSTPPQTTPSSTCFVSVSQFLLLGNVGIGHASPTTPLDMKGTLTVRNEADSVFAAVNTGSGNFLTIDAFNAGNTIKYPVCLAPYGGNVGIGTTTPQTALDVNGTLQLNAPITQTYTVLPTFTNTQIGYTMNQSARTSSGTAVSLNTAASLANIILPVAGVWLINYTGGLNLTVAGATAGNVTFGLHPSSALIAPIIGTIRFSFPAAVLPLSSPAFQGTGSYVHSGASTTYYLNYLVSGQATWTTTLSTMTATRIA